MCDERPVYVNPLVICEMCGATAAQGIREVWYGSQGGRVLCRDKAACRGRIEDAATEAAQISAEVARDVFER